MFSGDWYAVDSSGRDLSTGWPPRGRGAPTAVAALAAAPVVTWPLEVVSAGGRRLSFADVVGIGGDRVERLLLGIVAPRAWLAESGLVQLAQDTPAGPVDLPVVLVSLETAAEIAALVDPVWVASVERRRLAPRRVLLDKGRGNQLEAALHVAMLLSTERLPPTEDGADVRAASGGQLWLLGGAVAAALAGDDVFDSWAELMGCGLWPIGPVGGRLMVGEPAAVRGSAPGLFDPGRYVAPD